jgi:hypothetical protein
VGTSTQIQLENARREYQNALQTPKVKDFSKWINTWEQAMSIAISKKFPGSDLAIQQILPTWIVSYRISKHLEICNGTLGYCTVANDLRREVNLMRPALSRRAAKGSFRATYGDAYDSEGDTESSTRGMSTKKNRRNKNKNKGMEDNKSSTSERVLTKVRIPGY